MSPSPAVRRWRTHASVLRAWFRASSDPLETYKGTASKGSLLSLLTTLDEFLFSLLRTHRPRRTGAGRGSADNLDALKELLPFYRGRVKRIRALRRQPRTLAVADQDAAALLRELLYAHFTEAETGLAANALADRLIDGMGFDPLDLASMIAPQLPLEIDGRRDDRPLFVTSAAPLLPTLTVDLPSAVPLPVSVEASAMPSFSFDPLAYPVAGNKRYQGKFRFAKHYYRVLANLKDGGARSGTAPWPSTDTHGSATGDATSIPSRPRASGSRPRSAASTPTSCAN